ncbi:MAG TPA: hypothetical protein VKE94_20210, partial [Gemmataceae bacterium]|nr:hypothetical protein [Gemmataceae bacterium]
IGFPANVVEPICERLREKTGLAREQVLINSSHTHTGPQVSLKPPDQDEPAGEPMRTIEYTRQLQDKVVALVEQAAKKLEPASLAWGTGVVHFVMNRREFTSDGVKLGANPRGLADRSVPVLQISGADGKLRAVLFGAAVHNTTPRSDYFQICADYAGFAQTLIEEKYPGAEALFMLGCAGDADPYPFGNIDLASQHGTELGMEVCRVLDAKKLSPVRGPLKVTFTRADLPLEAVPSRGDLQKLVADKRSPKTWGAAQLLEMIERGENPPTHYTCPIALWQFGNDLTLVGLSGEVVVDYVPLLEKALGANKLWIAAYCNDVFGYLPSAHVLSEGGYETRGLYTGGAGFFAPEAQDVVVRTVRALADKAGRPPK